MDKVIIEGARIIRAEIIEMLNQCSDNQQSMFKRMYSHKDLTKSIENIVEEIPNDKLSWCHTQLTNTVAKK